MANLRWIKHVRAYAKKHNITYMCAVGKASATYKKTKRTKPKAVKKTKPKPVKKTKPKPVKKNKIKNKNVKDIIKLIQKFYDFEKGAHLKVIHNTLKNQYREMKGWTNAEINEAFDRLPNKEKYF